MLRQPGGNTRTAMVSRRSVPGSDRHSHGREWCTRTATPPPRPVRPEGSHYGHIISSPRHHGYLFPAEERCQVDAAPIAPQMQYFYGREACNVELPNIDVAILLGGRVLVNVTATGDINGVTAAKRSCSSVRQSAGRPPHLPAPGMAWNLLGE
ncbi:hypothetical protein TcCL_NonESM09148 [Trypanosoma cruzi]|nr:hypothetical protein TcCL_NonESM09148 [Trypanosoma cruzi]